MQQISWQSIQYSSWHLTQNQKCLSHYGTRGKGRGSPKSVGFIAWDHGGLYCLSWQFIQQLLRYFRLDQSGGPTDWPTTYCLKIFHRIPAMLTQTTRVPLSPGCETVFTVAKDNWSLNQGSTCIMQHFEMFALNCGYCWERPGFSQFFSSLCVCAHLPIVSL